MHFFQFQGFDFVLFQFCKGLYSLVLLLLGLYKHFLFMIFTNRF